MNTKTCTRCKATLIVTAANCHFCGELLEIPDQINASQGTKGWAAPAFNTPTPGSTGNDSGTGLSAVIPEELRGFNWGGLLLPLFWSFSHRVWIGLFALLGMVPKAGWLIVLLIGVVIGSYGNVWAWQNRRWNDVEHFRSTQRVWTIWGVGINLIWITLIAIALSAASRQRPYQRQFETPMGRWSN
jgi:hypothetical protein